MTLSGLSGFEKNLHAKDAPVSFPPIWTVPWLKFAQYDASIEQPLIRNAGEALGVTALLNSVRQYPQDTLFRSSMDIKNLNWIEDLLKVGPDPLTKKQLSGLTSPKWPSDIFGDDPLEDRSRARQTRPQALRGDLRRMPSRAGQRSLVRHRISGPEHLVLGALGDHRQRQILERGPEERKGMGTDPAQASVLATRTVQVPGFLKLDPAQTQCLVELQSADISSTDMPYSVGLMVLVDIVSRKAMDDQMSPKVQQATGGKRRKNCPNPGPQPADDEPPVSRAPAQRRLGHRALPAQRIGALALLDAEPRGRAPQIVLHGWRSRLRSEAGRLRGRRRWRELQDRAVALLDAVADGTEINGNSNAGHSFDGTPAPARTAPSAAFKEHERYDLIEYLKTL